MEPPFGNVIVPPEKLAVPVIVKDEAVKAPVIVAPVADKTPLEVTLKGAELGVAAPAKNVVEPVSIPRVDAPEPK